MIFYQHHNQNVGALLVLSKEMWFAMTEEKEKLPGMLTGQKQQLYVKALILIYATYIIALLDLTAFGANYAWKEIPDRDNLVLTFYKNCKDVNYSSIRIFDFTIIV